MTTETLQILSYDINIRISEAGYTDTILFVHGVGASSRDWMPLARELKKSANLYIPDLPGLGKSSKPHDSLTTEEQADVLYELIMHAGHDRVTLVGNSFGCQIIIDMLHRYYPKQVKRAVLIGPTVNKYERSVPMQILRLLQDALHEPLLAYLILARDYIYCGARRLFQGTVHAVRDKPEAKLDTITIPVLVIRGREDVNAPSYWVDEIVERLPHGKLLQFGSGHAVHINARKETARVIQDFMGINPSSRRNHYGWIAIVVILITLLLRRGRAK